MFGTFFSSLTMVSTLFFVWSDAAFSQDYSGEYKIVVKCAGGNGFGKLDIQKVGAQAFSIVGSSKGGKYSGSIEGGQFSMNFVGSGNEAKFTATSLVPGAIEGFLTQKSSFGGDCQWVATRDDSNAIAEAPKRAKSKNGRCEKDAISYLSVVHLRGSKYKWQNSCDAEINFVESSLSISRNCEQTTVNIGASGTMRSTSYHQQAPSAVVACYKSQKGCTLTNLREKYIPADFSCN